MATAIWFVAHNYTPADANSIQAVVPENGTYADLTTGDMCMVYNNGQTDILTYDSTSSTTQNIPLVVTSDGNAGNGRWLKKEFSRHNKNGFAVQQGPQPNSLATIGVAGTTFTLTFVAEYSYFVGGAKYTVTSGNKTVEITDVEGVHWIYFDTTGTLVIAAPTVDTDPLILDNCLVAAVYWDATNNQALLLFDERHGAGMAPTTHHHLHETQGASFESGLALGAFDTNGNGQSATHAQFDLASGEFHDEDNEITVDADTDATIDTFYRLGVGGPWRKATATAGYPVADPITGARMDWNDYNGGTWQLVELTNNDYVLTHYFVTNDVLGGGVIGIMGQADYSTLPAARAGAETELNSLLTGTLPLPEILPIATVIWKTSSTMTNQVMGAVYSVTGGGDYIDWRTADVSGVGVSINDHESLTGLLGGAAADHYHLTSVQETDLTDGGNTLLHYHNTLSDAGENGAGYSAGGAIELKYNNILAMSTGPKGIIVADTAGAEPYIYLTDASGNNTGGFLTFGSDAYFKNYVVSGHVYLRAVNAASAATSLFLGDPDGEATVYYAGLVATKTSASGLDVLDTSGDTPQLTLKSSDATLRGTLIGSATDFYLKSATAGANLVLQANAAAGAYKTILTGDPDAGVSLYYTNLTAFKTNAAGISVFDTAGNDPILTFKTDADAIVAQVLGSATDFIIRGMNHGSNIQLQQEDAAGTVRTILQGDPDGVTTLYYDGLTACATSASGLHVFDTSGNHPKLSFYEDDGTTIRGSIFANLTSDLYIQSFPHGGSLWISAENSSGTSMWVGIQPNTPSFHPSPNNTLSIGKSGNVWTAVWATDPVIQTSDRAQKIELGQAHGLNFINRLRPIRFQWNEGKRPHYGLIAQEVKQALDDHGIDSGLFVDPAVNNPENVGVEHPKSLRYGELITPLIKCVQELDLRFKALNDARISQRNQILNLLDRIEVLEAV